MQVSDWFEQVGDVYLNKKDLGSSLAMANALRDEQVHFERQARVRSPTHFCRQYFHRYSVYWIVFSSLLPVFRDTVVR